MLKFSVEHGLVLQKVHRAIKFKQSRWLEPYINFNTQKRKEPTTDFEKEFFKLMHNAP